MVVRAPSRHAPAREVELRARTIRIVVLDLDGVLTDGRVTIDARGRESRTFHERDRAGIGLLVRAGLQVAALTVRRTSAVPAYARNLRLTTVLQGAGEGLASVRRLCRRRHLDLDAVAYVGHDVLDLPLLAAVGLAVSVVDGDDHAKRSAHWVTSGPGGDGAVREVAERILRAQGKWASTMGEAWRRWD